MIKEPLKILVVEDNFTDVALIQRQIRKCIQDPEIVVSDKIIQTRHAMKTFIPDVVFTDFQLVGFTGLEVIENVQEIYPNIPIIVITGTLNDEELAAKVVMQGASGFLLKKNMSKLHERLEPMLKRILEDKAVVLLKLEKERKEREKLNEIQSLLKEAAQSHNSSEYTQDYYKKILMGIEDRIKTIIK
ncbi:CheY chemotaxis protein or a CheY-like REC (receiver) domain [Nonlabens sp. Hel1_33_55]|uniref:response regulator n=1 Tax=Nonlabens sp. Hel1_33_55 TaxID=1336802 RepID=UPI000875AA38|nr:response regulator [Nonlabens sp. Hel1_33_55]SCY35633.1 CheY chemotaxis protein or a CheY-like REC (receiver) domain [Nonlabens sp. Hel1_33_55]